MNGRLPTRTDGGQPRMATAAVREVLRSQGRPLDGSTRALMESRFGHDFSQVRVHTDDRAARSAAEVDAAAYTTGRNIVFARGAYAPGSSTGQRLLAHELAHTIQQGKTTERAELPVADVHAASEREAHRAGDAVAAGESFSVKSRARASVARQPASPQGAAVDNRVDVEQALVSFLKQVKHADATHPLATNQRVWTEAMRLAQASKAPPAAGPVRTRSASDVQTAMKQLLEGPTAPATPEGLAQAIVAILPGPVDAAELAHLKSLSVFKESQPTGVAGIVSRYQKGAPAAMPPQNPVDESDKQKQDYAMGKLASSPTLSPPLDPSRVYGAIAGGREKDKPEFKTPPVAKAEEPAGPGGVVNRDIQLPSTLPALTADRPIHFRLNEPSPIAPSDAALRAALTQEGVSDLERVTGWLQQRPEFSAQLTGMASIEGPAEHNRQLSENRARSIASALMRTGISAARIADVPGKPESCSKLSFGLYACGPNAGSKAVDPNDRQVRVRLFVTPKGPDKL